MLLTSEAVEQALAHTSPGEFYRPAHAHVFDAVAALYGAGEPVDTVTVAAELRRQGLLDEVGGAAKLVEWQAGTPAAGNADHYAKIVARCAHERAALHLAGELAEKVHERPADPQATFTEFGRRLNALAERASPPADLAAAALVDEFLEDRRRARDEGTNAVLTPWPRLNDLTGGLMPGGFVTVAARTGVGKTAFAANLLLHAAAKVPVLFVSLEMGRLEVMRRLVSAAMRLQYPQVTILGENIRDMKMPPEWVELFERVALDMVAPLSFSILDDPTADMSRVAAAAKGARVVIYDYLQLAPDDGTSENRQVQVARTARALKVLALQSGASVVALAQLNREADREKGKVPQLSQIRESGAVEQDSNQVWFLTQSKGELLVHVAKNREGRTTMTGDWAERNEPDLLPVRLQFIKNMGLLQASDGDLWGDWSHQVRLAGEDW